MKKSVGIMLAFLILAAMPFAPAEGTYRWPRPLMAPLSMFGDAFDLDLGTPQSALKEEMEELLALGKDAEPVSEEKLDRVDVLDNGEILVQNALITVRINPLDGWDYFGQDIWGQLWEYYQYFRDPLQAINAILVDNDENMVIISEDTNLWVFVSISGDDPLIPAVGELNTMEEDRLKSLVQVIQAGEPEWTVTAEMRGDNRFLIFDRQREGKHFRIYQHYTGGARIRIRIEEYEGVLPEEIIAELDEIAGGFHFVPNQEKDGI